jgi:uncharacterized protein YcnI
MLVNNSPTFKGIFMNTRISTFILCLLLSQSVFAHVVLEQKEATAGEYYKATFKVSHGCSGSPTNTVTVSIPNGFRGAKPMVKPGWQINATKTKLSEPYTSHGRTISEDTTEITWSGGNLPSAYYDEFVVVGQLPSKAGSMYWKVSQFCDQGRQDWNQIPEPGKTLQDYPFPAALLNILPMPDQHHDHQH